MGIFVSAVSSNGIVRLMITLQVQKAYQRINSMCKLKFILDRLSVATIYTFFNSRIRLCNL